MNLILRTCVIQGLTTDLLQYNYNRFLLSKNLLYRNKSKIRILFRVVSFNKWAERLFPFIYTSLIIIPYFMLVFKKVLFKDGLY